MSEFILINEDNEELEDLKLLKRLLKRKKKNKKKKDKYKDIGITTSFNEDTTVFYKSIRKAKIDPILNDELLIDTAYQFPYMWDPYTGIINGKDPYGSLYFDPDILIYSFWIKRLNNLWINEIDENDGYYSGYYSDGVGAGENFTIVGRGSHPERYIFRIPIIDIYLTEDHNEQITTLGPKLDYNEIENIYNLALKQKNNYKKKFKNNRPNLIKMKFLYDIAISKNPEEFLKKNKSIIKTFTDLHFNLCTCSNCNKISMNIRLNRYAIEILKKI